MSAQETMAVFGMSADPSKYGYKIFKRLTQLGFTVYGINPKGGVVEGHRVYALLADVPAPVQTAIMVVPPVALLGAVEQCIKARVKCIWFQPGAQNKDAFAAAEKAGIDAIDGCYMAENGLW